LKAKKNKQNNNLSTSKVKKAENQRTKMGWEDALSQISTP
jgi:hypothetical protein